MKQIPLTRGKFTIVDDDVFEWASQHRWHTSNRGYALRKVYLNGKAGGGQYIHLHRIVTGAVEGQEVDHINHDTLDNRRCNLRVCSHAQNLWNVRKRTGCTSEYKGVYWDAVREKWGVTIRTNGRTRGVGRFATELEAARVYDEAVRAERGEFAVTNLEAVR